MPPLSGSSFEPCSVSRVLAPLIHFDILLPDSEHVPFSNVAKVSRIDLGFRNGLRIRPVDAAGAVTNRWSNDGLCLGADLPLRGLGIVLTLRLYSHQYLLDGTTDSRVAMQSSLSETAGRSTVLPCASGGRGKH